MSEQKKEALIKFHRANIIKAVEKLFLEKGIEGTTMDNIAKEADYSKATLYAYFKNKEELISSITLISMQLFQESIAKVLSAGSNYRELSYALCYAMVDFQREYPLYYDCLLREINVDFDLPGNPKVYQEIYDVGEETNKLIASMFEEGIQQGYFRSDIKVLETVYLFWASISGVIRMSTQKEKFFAKHLGITREEFIRYSFDTLLKSISTGKEGIISE